MAVIDGVALGGGCELVLSCCFRVATFNEKVKIGLPEVHLGVIPGFGGTYRLPRLLGLKEALKMIVGGKALSARKAHKIGLVDRLFPQEGLMRSVEKFVEEIIARKDGKIRSLPQKCYAFLRGSQNGFAILRPQKISPKAFWESTRLGQSILFAQSRKTVLQMTKGFYPAPLKAMEVIQKTYGRNRAKALVFEARAFAELFTTEVSKNLIRVFYLGEKCKKFFPTMADAIKPKAINKCAVVGAGVM